MPLFVLLFGIMLIFAPIWAVLQAVFTEQLRKKYPETAKKFIGPPRKPWDYSFSYAMRWLGFVLGRRYRVLSDRTLNREGNALFAVVIVVLFSWIAIMVAPSGVFIRLPF